MIHPESIYNRFEPEEREHIEALPRAERLMQMASLKNRAIREYVQEIAEVTELPVLDTIELIENPTMALPLRLIHEYQCLPVKTQAQENPAEDAPAANEDTIALVTLWPPSERMNRWIFAVSGRTPEWYLSLIHI